MKIVSWNCNGAFRTKFESISKLQADIYIIQECENPIEAQHQKYQKWANNYFWTGDSKNKGLAIFAKPNVDIKRLNWSNKHQGHIVKHFLPCRINQEFDLLAVWTHHNKSPTFKYIGQLWRYLQINLDKIDKTIIAGDLNSNVIWDVWDRWWNHSDVVRMLEEKNIHSFYHFSNGEKQGEETIPTLYFQKNVNKPYHIDYIFGHENYKQRIKKVVIGKYQEWINFSDHMPIMCEFE